LIGWGLPATSQPLPRFNVETPVQRLALVVGNADYLNADRLPGSLTDARAMAKKLEEHGFKVTLAENVATRSDFLNEYLSPFLAAIEEGAFVVFYFSGHGFTYGGESYLAPLEFPPKVPSTQVFTTFISASALQERINNRKPTLLVMVLDACRNIGGFIEAMPGHAGDVEKGLGNLRIEQNNIVGYATAQGHISIGDGGGGLSNYTGALLEFLTGEDVELIDAHRRTVEKVREGSAHKQSPWLYGSWTLQIYFNPSARVTAQYKDAWVAAQQADTPQAIRSYLNVFALGPYAASARLWLTERSKQASTFTQFSPPQIDALWSAAGAGPVSAPRITGPFGLARTTTLAQTNIPRPPDSRSRRIQPSAASVAEVLAQNRDIVVLQPVAGRATPDPKGDVVASLTVGSRLSVNTVETDNAGRVWLRATTGVSADPVYVPVPQSAGIQERTLGNALREFELHPAETGSAALADERRIAEELRRLRAEGAQIAWVSISAPKAIPSTAENTPPRGAGLDALNLRAYHGAYLIGNSVPRGRISVVEGADFVGLNPRVRIFGM